MKSRYRVTTILFFSIALCCVKACEVDDVAVYKVKLHMYYEGYPGAHWSQVFGQSHNRSFALYRIGEACKTPIRDFIQFGNLNVLMEDGNEEPKVYDQFTAPAPEEEATESIVFVDGEHSLVSLISRMIPSTDWFIGVDSLDLCLHSSWVEEVTLDLELLAAGINDKDGDSKPVDKVSHKNPEFARSRLFNRSPRQIRPVAKAEFTKVKEYSSKELNDLARKELTKSKPKHNRNNKLNQDYKEELTTKNSFNQLKDLEEDPVGTPKPNDPKNNVVVVTKAPDFGESEENLSSELYNMDKVVVAVARGRKLGLSKHLPRHFKSRLHHAVNRRHGKDCKVSEWSNWSPCNEPCSEKTRVREIVQQKIGRGRDCPQLVQKEICGKCVRGDGDYMGQIGPFNKYLNLYLKYRS